MKEGRNRKEAIELMERYLVFKQECVDTEIFDIDEIIKLFEVHNKICS